MTATNSSAGLHTTTPYSTLLGNREVVALLSARLLSGIGDQAARAVLALYVLVSGQGGPLRSALVLAVAYVPATFGFAFLASVADRFPRRSVMLVSDVARALLIGVLAVAVWQGSSLWLLLTVLFCAEMFSGPSTAARSAILPDVARDHGEYQAAMGLGTTIDQLVQVVGFLAGGVALTVLGPSSALLFDAATFLVSFVLVLSLVRRRPAPADAGTSLRRLADDMVLGVRTVRSAAPLRATALLAWAAAGLLVATDAVALPYATDLGASDVQATALLAATPAGAAMAAMFVARLPFALQVRLVFPMAMASTAPLLATAVRPELPATWVLWFLTGLCQGYAVTVMTLVVLLTPERRRGRVTGVVGAGFNLMAVVAIVGLGALAQVTDPAAAVVLAGAAGLLMLALVALMWPHRDLRHALRTTYGTSTRTL